MDAAFDDMSLETKREDQIEGFAAGVEIVDEQLSHSELLKINNLITEVPEQETAQGNIVSEPISNRIDEAKIVEVGPMANRVEEAGIIDVEQEIKDILISSEKENVDVQYVTTAVEPEITVIGISDIKDVAEDEVRTSGGLFGFIKAKTRSLTRDRKLPKSTLTEDEGSDEQGEQKPKNKRWSLFKKKSCSMGGDSKDSNIVITVDDEKVLVSQLEVHDGVLNGENVVHDEKEGTASHPVLIEDEGETVGIPQLEKSSKKKFTLFASKHSEAKDGVKSEAFPKSKSLFAGFKSKKNEQSDDDNEVLETIKPAQDAEVLQVLIEPMPAGSETTVDDLGGETKTKEHKWFQFGKKNDAQDLKRSDTSSSVHQDHKWNLFGKKTVHKDSNLVPASIDVKTVKEPSELLENALPDISTIVDSNEEQDNEAENPKHSEVNVAVEYMPEITVGYKGPCESEDKDSVVLTTDNLTEECMVTDSEYLLTNEYLLTKDSPVSEIQGAAPDVVVQGTSTSLIFKNGYLAKSKQESNDSNQITIVETETVSESILQDPLHTSDTAETETSLEIPSHTVESKSIVADLATKSESSSETVTRSQEAAEINELLEITTEQLSSKELPEQVKPEPNCVEPKHKKSKEHKRFSFGLQRGKQQRKQETSSHNEIGTTSDDNVEDLEDAQAQVVDCKTKSDNSSEKVKPETIQQDKRDVAVDNKKDNKFHFGLKHKSHKKEHTSEKSDAILVKKNKIWSPFTKKTSQKSSAVTDIEEVNSIVNSQPAEPSKIIDLPDAIGTTELIKIEQNGTVEVMPQTEDDQNKESSDLVSPKSDELTVQESSKMAEMTEAVLDIETTNESESDSHSNSLAKEKAKYDANESTKAEADMKFNGLTEVHATITSVDSELSKTEIMSVESSLVSHNISDEGSVNLIKQSDVVDIERVASDILLAAEIEVAEGEIQKSSQAKVKSVDELDEHPESKYENSEVKKAGTEINVDESIFDLTESCDESGVEPIETESDLSVIALKDSQSDESVPTIELQTEVQDVTQTDTSSKEIQVEHQTEASSEKYPASHALTSSDVVRESQIDKKLDEPKKHRGLHKIFTFGRKTRTYDVQSHEAAAAACAEPATINQVSVPVNSENEKQLDNEITSKEYHPNDDEQKGGISHHENPIQRFFSFGGKHFNKRKDATSKAKNAENRKSIDLEETMEDLKTTEEINDKEKVKKIKNEEALVADEGSEVKVNVSPLKDASIILDDSAAIFNAVEVDLSLDLNQLKDVPTTEESNSESSRPDTERIVENELEVKAVEVQSKPPDEALTEEAQTCNADAAIVHKSNISGEVIMDVVVPFTETAVGIDIKQENAEKLISDDKAKTVSTKPPHQKKFSFGKIKFGKDKTEKAKTTDVSECLENQELTIVNAVVSNPETEDGRKDAVELNLQVENRTDKTFMETPVKSSGKPKDDSAKKQNAAPHHKWNPFGKRTEKSKEEKVAIETKEEHITSVDVETIDIKLQSVEPCDLDVIVNENETKHIKSGTKKGSYKIGKGLFSKLFSPRSKTIESLADIVLENPQEKIQPGDDPTTEPITSYTIQDEGQIVVETHWVPKTTVQAKPNQIVIVQNPVSFEEIVQNTVLALEGTEVSLREPRVSGSHFVVVAVDFGTTFSGYAFSFTSDPNSIHMMRKWEGGDPGVINQKTPTSILLNPDGEFHSFGFRARDFFHDLDAVEATRWMYFEKFKMALHSCTV